MIDTITIQNTVTSEQIEVSKMGSSVYVLDSIDWDECSIDFSSFSVPHQIGEFYNGVNVGTREPEITGYIIADKSAINKSGLTWNEYYNQQLQQINDTKEQFDKLINIYEDITVTAGEYMITGRPTRPPKYSIKETENNTVECYFTITIRCFNPLFYKGDRSVSLASVTDMFHFPLEIPSSGVVFGDIQQRSSIEVTNNGDVDSGCIITITAIAGGVSDPSVYNVNTGESMGFSGVTMAVGDTITINTNTGEESAVWHKIAENQDVSLIGYRTNGSTFFKVLKGTYSYAHSVDEADVNNVAVTIAFREQYFNLRGM